MGRANADRAREMEVFATCVKAGSLSAAGRDLGQTPSAISRTISRLEDRLGVRLLIRNTRSLVLTAEGTSYHRAAVRILRDLDEAEQTIGNLDAPQGTLKVNASIAFGRFAVVPLIPAFQEAYPGIDLDLSLQDTVADLLQGEVDVAIRVGPLPDSNLVARKLGESPRIIVASPGYLDERGAPERPEDLAAHNCLRFNFPRREAEWPFLRNNERFSIAVSGNTAVDSGEVMAQLAVAGHGIARIGRFHVMPDLQSGALVELLSGFDVAEIETFHAVFIAGENMPARARLFVDFLASKLPFILATPS